MKDIYYYHISPDNLAHVIVSGAIKPSSYMKDRNEDIQDVFPKSVILSNKKWGMNSTCSIAIVLSDKEKEQLKSISKDYFILNSFLPISRIYKIYFSEKDRSEVVRWNIESGAGYLPENWISVEERLNEDIVANHPSNDKEINLEILDLQKSISSFDRLMGGLAFMRTSIYDINDYNLNYPIDYIATLSFFNREVERELNNEGITLDRSLHQIFLGEAEIFNYLHKPITKEVVRKETEKRNLKLQEKFNLIILDNLFEDHFLLDLGVLYNYGEGKPKKTIDLLTSFYTQLDWKLKEEVSLIFGLHNGYQTLRNEYKVGELKWEVKFKMDNKIDFYILESLYDYVKDKSKTPGKFEFLEPVLPSSKKMKVPVTYEAYNILDTTIVTQESNYANKLQQLIKKITQEVLNWFPKDLFTPKENEIQKRIEDSIGSDFADAVKQIRNDFIRNIERNEALEKIEKISVNKETEESEKSIDYDVDAPSPTIELSPEKTRQEEHQELQIDNQIITNPQADPYAPSESDNNLNNNLESNQREFQKDTEAIIQNVENRETKEKSSYPQNEDEMNTLREEKEFLIQINEVKDKTRVQQKEIGGLFLQDSDFDSNPVDNDETKGNNEEISIDELKQFNDKKLRAYAKKRGFKGYSKMSKMELYEFILNQI